MSRVRTLLLALCAAAALLVLPGAAGAAPIAAKAGKKGPAVQGALTGCKTRSAARLAVFKGSMPTWSGFSGRMEMRFDLFARVDPDGTWLPVEVDGFGGWDVSEPGVGVFIIKKRVGGLLSGYSYRSVIRYRWRNGAGKVVRSARRVTAACAQPDIAADLQLSDPSIVPGPRDDVVVYRATVKNTGSGSASAFDVVLAVNGVAQPPQRLGPLAPGASVPVDIQAPRCQAGTIVRFTVDAKAEIGESNETNNALERRCAAPKASAAAR